MIPLPFVAALMGKRTLILGSLLAVVALGLGVALYGAYKHAAGKREGIGQDRARSDAVIAGMLADAQTRLIAANEEAAAREEVWRLRLKEAQRVADQDRQLNTQRLAAERAASGQLRDQLATYAAGGLKASTDTVAACRERSATLGVVVAEVLLPALADCAAAAEDHAGGVRTLLNSWPVNSD